MLTFNIWGLNFQFFSKLTFISLSRQRNSVAEIQKLKNAKHWLTDFYSHQSSNYPLINSILIKNLKRVERKELPRFTKFVDFRGNEKGVELLKIIERTCPNWSAQQLKKLNEVQIAKQLYSDGNAVSNLKRLRSQLNTYLQEFLIFQDLFVKGKNKEQVDLLWLEMLLKKGWYEQFDKDWKKIKDNIARRSQKNSDYFFKLYRLEDLQRQFVDINRREKSHVNFQEFFNHFEQFTIIEKLKYSCFAALVENVQDIQHQIPMLEELEEQLATNILLETNPVINIYYCLWKVFKDKNTDLLFSKVEPLLTKHQPLFSNEERKDLNNLALSYLINRINTVTSDRVGHIKSLFSWYQAIIKNRLVYEGGHIPHQRFKNIVSAAILLKKFDWGDKFITNSNKDVNLADREELRSFIEGTVFFYRGDYFAAIKVLQHKAVPKNDFYYYDINTLLQRAYYETGDFEQVMLAFHRIRKKLKRDHKTANVHKQSYAHFSNFLAELVKIKEDVNLSKIQKSKLLDELEKKVETAKPVVHRAWLFAKIGAK